VGGIVRNNDLIGKPTNLNKHNQPISIFYVEIRKGPKITSTIGFKKYMYSELNAIYDSK